MDLPVTLIIKAPSQSVGDQTIDCMLGWTVKKLKQHLSDVYPSKPFEDGSTQHTVHLVFLSPTSDARSSNACVEMTHSRQDSSSSDNSQYNSGSPDTDGLRHRGFRNSSPSNSQQFTPSMTQNVFNPYSPVGQMPMNMNQYMASISPESLMMQSMASPGGAFAFSPEQYMWMQQMYAQYMAQYMQFYQQQNVYTTPPNTPEPTVPPENQPHNVQHVNANAAAEDAEADEDFRQRDWLDYIYICSRVLVLVGIVYFYSSWTRFLLVGLFFIVVYIYQVGWLMIGNRRRHEREQNGRNDQPQNIVQANPDQENPVAAAPATAEAQPRSEPGMFQILWTFFSTFFLSLFPVQPRAVNAN